MRRRDSKSRFGGGDTFESLESLDCGFLSRGLFINGGAGNSKGVRKKMNHPHPIFQPVRLLGCVRPEIRDFWMELSAVSIQRSANHLFLFGLADG
jgi:hypothetical protein